MLKTWLKQQEDKISSFNAFFKELEVVEFNNFLTMEYLNGLWYTEDYIHGNAKKGCETLLKSQRTTTEEKLLCEKLIQTFGTLEELQRRERQLMKSKIDTRKASHENEGVDPSAASLVDRAQIKEVSSPTSSGTKLLEKDQEPLKEDKLHDESQEQDLKDIRLRKKYSSGRGKRGKRRTISTESPMQDSQDVSKEKADENMETRKTDASGGKLLDIVSDDQPLSRCIDGMHSPIPIHSPGLFQYKLQESDTFCNRSQGNWSDLLFYQFQLSC